VHLEKRIPLSAGLAGGSSDAAATLAGLNEVWRLELTAMELALLAADLGSDVAFFLHTPAAWCTGRGEQVTPVALARPRWFVVACPSTGLSTAEVYRRVVVPAQPFSGDEIGEALIRGTLQDLGSRLHNRLQAVAEDMCPDVSSLLKRFRAAKPLGWLMSGSGSAVFALCENQDQAERVAREVRNGMTGDATGSVFTVCSCI
jgi:4-diphosphocytidyl-2-C-methyl-D-erythritol kinase